MSWDYGRLVAEVYELDKPVGSSFPGLEVEGLDTSPDMLAVCRQHCRDRGLDPVLREADMTGFAEPAAYQAIIIPAASIMLLDGRDEAPRALAAFRESLVPGGRPGRGR